MNTPKKAKILVVDDDEIILIALEETLTLENYEITTTSSAFKALQIVKENTFSVVISDQRMAEMTGLELLGEIKQIAPNTSRILITGVLTLKTVIDAINKGEIYRFISKPWLREDLLATVNNAAQRYNLLKTNEELQANTLQLNQQLAEANSELKNKIKALEEQKRELDKANNALQKNFDHSLDLVYRITDTYHPLLGKETKSVVELCQYMIQAGEFTENEKKILLTSAWLHKVGLIGISRELLSKARNHPEKLTEEENYLFRLHPTFGQILAQFVDEMEDAGTVIRSAYERHDGSGYPDGIEGENVPKMARYLSVAIYFVESNLSRKDALDRILAESGKMFHKDAVALFAKANRIAELPQKVREVSLKDLQPGHVLAKGLHSPTGLLLVSEGERLSPGMVEKIKKHHEKGHLAEHVLIYRH
jgi:response regulator RpfG family c-di-GMP phosphodiesterase